MKYRGYHIYNKYKTLHKIKVVWWKKIKDCTKLYYVVYKLQIIVAYFFYAEGGLLWRKI